VQRRLRIKSTRSRRGRSGAGRVPVYVSLFCRVAIFTYRSLRNCLTHTTPPPAFGRPLLLRGGEVLSPPAEEGCPRRGGVVGGFFPSCPRRGAPEGAGRWEVFSPPARGGVPSKGRGGGRFFPLLPEEGCPRRGRGGGSVVACSTLPVAASAGCSARRSWTTWSARAALASRRSAARNSPSYRPRSRLNAADSLDPMNGQTAFVLDLDGASVRGMLALSLPSIDFGRLPCQSRR
jgi:hypothetical protein